MKAKFDGPWLDLLEITLKNFILRIVTLGIYHPWARVNVRRFMWRHFMIEGERFEFSGNGKELFIGFVKLVGVFSVFLLVVTLTRIYLPFAEYLFRGLIWSAYLILVPYFIYSARRYLLSRTKWRSIRFGLSRVRREYIISFFIGTVASVLTLGLALPWARLRNHKILTEATMYGGVPFKFEGQLRDYYIIHLKALVLIPLTLGIYYAWFSSELTRYNFKHTKFDGATMRMDIYGGEMFGIFLLTAIVSIITLGLGLPWATCYRARHLSERFGIDGSVDFEKLQKMTTTQDTFADSVVDYFDLDLGW